MSAFSAYEMSLSATLEPPNQTKLLIPNAVTAPMLNIPDALWGTLYHGIFALKVKEEECWDKVFGAGGHSLQWRERAV